MAESKGQPTLIEAIVGLLVLTGIGWGLLHFTGCGRTTDPPQPPAVPKIAFEPPPAPKAHLADTESTGPVEDSGPLAEARARVRKFEQKRAQVEPLLEKALEERDELVAKLREAGVTKPADLRGNVRGQKLAGSVQRLSGEIKGLERQIAAINSAIVEARAVVRRLEREQAGISEDEMRKLSEQLREAEERTDGAANPITPLDVESALEKVLKGGRNSKSLQSPTRTSSKRLVGKWEIVEGEQKGTATFTDGGTVLFVWYHTGLKNWTDTGSYSLVGKSLKIKAAGEYGQESVRDIEFLSDDELLIQRPRGLDFTWLYGRLKRVK